MNRRAFLSMPVFAALGIGRVQGLPTAPTGRYLHPDHFDNLWQALMDSRAARRENPGFLGFTTPISESWVRSWYACKEPGASGYIEDLVLPDEDA